MELRQHKTIKPILGPRPAALRPAEPWLRADELSHIVAMLPKRGRGQILVSSKEVWEALNEAPQGSGRRSAVARPSRPSIWLSIGVGCSVREADTADGDCGLSRAQESPRWARIFRDTGTQGQRVREEASCY